MSVVGAVAASRSRAGLCVLLLAGCVLVSGCGSAGSSDRSSSTSIGSGSRVALASSTTALRAAHTGSAAARERQVSLAAARRVAARLLSAEREAAAVRAARGELKRRPGVRVALAARSARAQQRAALARAKRVSALAVKADPGSCLTGSGVLAASRAASRAKTTAAALRVRELVVRCLRESQMASRPLLHAGGGRAG
jgi:hypothetical protein